MAWDLNLLRIIEDSFSTAVIVISIILLINLNMKYIKEGPIYSRIWVMIISLLPFLFWKSIKAFMRIFLEEGTLRDNLDSIGELFETLAGPALGVSFIIMWYFYKKTYG